jgi:SAM-dependent methyltransferase
LRNGLCNNAGQDSKFMEEFKNRSDFIQDLVDLNFGEILEIGPLNRPLMVGPNVKYFDLFPAPELRAKASNEGLDPSTVPEIDFFDSNGDISGINAQFSLIVSSHVLEHQPDFVRHLQNVSRLLKKTGTYAFIVPDARYCFDHYISTSSLTAILRSHEEGKRKPDVWNVIEHRALTTHNDPARHWDGDSGDALSNLKQRWQEAVKEYLIANDSYIDVHCWQFTPDSLKVILKALYILDYIDLEIVQVFATPKNDLEFCTILRKY